MNGENPQTLNFPVINDRAGAEMAQNVGEITPFDGTSVVTCEP